MDSTYIPRLEPVIRATLPSRRAVTGACMDAMCGFSSGSVG